MEVNSLSEYQDVKDDLIDSASRIYYLHQSGVENITTSKPSIFQIFAKARVRKRIFPAFGFEWFSCTTLWGFGGVVVKPLTFHL